MINKVWKWITDNKSISVEIITLLVLIAAAVAGYMALFHYDKANKAQMIYTLYEFDKETVKAVMEKPYLQAIYVQPQKNIDIKQSSLQLLSLFDKNCNISLNWKDIPELFNNLFSQEIFYCCSKERIREGYFVAESILYTLFNSYLAKEDKLINERDYETYAGYFNEVGHNPLFLCAIFDGHKHSYITKEFAKEIQNRLEKNEYIKEVIKKIYPDLSDPDWPRRIGNMN